MFPASGRVVVKLPNVRRQPNREQTEENFNSSLQQNYLVLTRDYSSQSIAELLSTYRSKFNSSLVFFNSSVSVSVTFIGVK